MNIQDFSDEEFLVEARRRVDSGRYSPDEYMSRHQSDDRGKLGILRSAILVMKNSVMQATGKCPEWLQSLASTCDELDGILGNPLPEKAFAVNTTFVGKDTAFQDHAPKLTKADDPA